MMKEHLMPSTAMNEHPADLTISLFDPRSYAIPSRQKYLMVFSQPLFSFLFSPQQVFPPIQHSHCFGNEINGLVDSSRVREILQRAGSRRLPAPGFPAPVAAGQ